MEDPNAKQEFRKEAWREAGPVRYFIITFSHYKHIDDATIFGDGMITMQCETFPNKKGIEQDIKEENPDIENITILNIIELSGQDFKDFTE